MLKNSAAAEFFFGRRAGSCVLGTVQAYSHRVFILCGGRMQRERRVPGFDVT